jgi:hypothetical protein
VKVRPYYQSHAGGGGGADNYNHNSATTRFFVPLRLAGSSGAYNILDHLIR